MQHQVSEYKRPITALEVPVHVYLFFTVHKLKHFTVSDIVQQMEAEYKMQITHRRVNQILNDFVKSNILKKEQRPSVNAKNKPVSHYIFIEFNYGK